MSANDVRPKMPRSSSPTSSSNSSSSTNTAPKPSMSKSALLNDLTFCFASCSIGQPTDHLPTRLSHLASAGFSQIELSFPDLKAFAEELEGREVGEKEWEVLGNAAAKVKVKEECEERGLEIFVLQPFGKIEGWKEGSEERKDALERLDGWIEIMKKGGIRTLQVGSSDAEGIDTSRSAVIRDLRILCDKLKEADPSFRVMYENWCWSSHAPASQDVYEIVNAVERDNIFVNLDTFQHAGAEWADPTKEDGRIDAPDRDALFHRSLTQLSSMNPTKIGFLQLSDAYRVSPPLEDKTSDSLRPRGRWSHDYRPLPLSSFSGAEGYLPVVEVFRAVLRSGWRGTVSVEVFDGGPKGEGLGEVDLAEWAREGRRSVEKLIEAVAEGE